MKFKDVANKESLWTRMKQNFQDGNIMLALSIACFSRIGLTDGDESIEFAVIDSLEKEEHFRAVKLKDPTNRHFPPIKMKSNKVLHST